MSEEKLCKLCKKTKPVTEYYKCKRYKDGLQYICKECYKVSYYPQWTAKKRKQYYNDNREDILRKDAIRRHKADMDK